MCYEITVEDLRRPPKTRKMMPWQVKAHAAKMQKKEIKITMIQETLIDKNQREQRGDEDPRVNGEEDNQ